MSALGMMLLGCDGDGSSNAPELVRAAITAHGGPEALRNLDNLRVSSRVLFRDGVELQRELHFRAPSDLSMTISRDGGTVMTFGVAGDRCWQQHREFVLPCRPDDERDYRRIVEVLCARALHRVDLSAVSDAGTLTIDGRRVPAVRVGGLRLAFDPETHLLVRIDYPEPNGLWVESFSAFQEREGATVATRRALTIDGAPDVSETWIDIVPGGADATRFTSPAEPRAGDVFSGDDTERPVAWVALGDLPSGHAADALGESRLTHARGQLEAFVHARGMRASRTDGLVLLTLPDGAQQVALALEADRRFEDVDEGIFHITTWPSAAFVGVFVRGDSPADPEDALRRALSAHGKTAAPGAPRQLVLYPGAELQPAAERVGLLRVSVSN